MNPFLSDLYERRLNNDIGGIGVRSIELMGGRVIEPTAFEPDPQTCRDEHYYNAATNTLYKRIVVRKEFGILAAYWQRISS